ncbi:MAG TPA: FGGY-family carbohydrate kinase [Feifaniaceae bacterium]|nr:FGGY-family carbohydrate kinase [Feifaniaceae bacterium]
MPYIGLDVGTSGCKASVVDHTGAVLAFAHEEYAPASPKPGYIEISARAVWAAVKSVLHRAARPDITALAIASFGEAAILLDARDNVLSNSIYYSDVRGSEEVNDILAALPPGRAQAVTGTAANPMYTANKLLWIKKHQPELLVAARHIMLFGDYIGFLLTGERAIDYSLASRTMLFDVMRGRWSDEVASALGLSIEGFSAPVRAGTRIGKLLPDIALELGLGPDVTVVAGGHDQMLAALGGGVVTRGDSVDGMGSSECISLMIHGRDVAPEMADYNFCNEPYVFEDSFLTLAFNASSGTSIRWYKECFEKERARYAKESGKSLYALMEAECPEGPTDLFFLPHVGGSGTPHIDSTLGGAFLGLTVATGRGDCYKAVLEGICYEMQYNAELLRSCGLPVNEITAVGGSTQSRLLMQIKADIMDRPVHTLEVNETGTMGLALLCAYALRDIPDLASAAKNAARRRETFYPDPARAAVYGERMRQYRRIYPAIKSVWHTEN